MLLTDKMKQDLFSPSEKTIIEYMFKQRENIKDKTTKQISKETYTHPSTLIRIAKKLGFKGWLDLKDVFLQEIEYLNSHFNNVDANFPFNENDSIMTIANKMALLSQTTINDTLSLLSFEDLQKATMFLEKAKEIKIFSLENNFLLCHDFKAKMNRIGKRVHLCEVDAEYEAASSDSSTCAMVISYSGETRSILRVLPMLKQKKTPIIALTSIGNNSLARYSDCVLRITTREKLYSKIDSFSSNDSIRFLLDVLYSCVFSRNYRKNLEYKIRISKYFDHRKSTNKVLREDHRSVEE